MKYKLKATTLEAYKWTGIYDEKTTPKWLLAAMKKKGDQVGAARIVNNEVVKVVTERGILTAYKGDFVVKDPEGALYPVSGQVLELFNAEASE